MLKYVKKYVNKRADTILLCNIYNYKKLIRVILLLYIMLLKNIFNVILKSLHSQNNSVN